MDPLIIEVPGLPPAKNEAKSLLSAGHPYAARVATLLRAALEATQDTSKPYFGRATVGMELVLRSPTQPPSDATNYLGGVGDVLEDKSRRGGLTGPGELMQVALYVNDRQIQEVRYRWVPGPGMSYRLRFWALGQKAQSADPEEA